MITPVMKISTIHKGQAGRHWDGKSEIRFTYGSVERRRFSI